MEHKAPSRAADDVVLYTNPTHLERKSAFLVLFAWAFCALVSGYGTLLWHVPLWALLPPLLILGLAALTSEAATDVGAVGLIAAMFRARLGSRSAFEWADARFHYFRLAEWPMWRAHCEASYRSLRRRMRSFPTLGHKPATR
jgi:hypothetical protein